MRITRIVESKEVVQYLRRRQLVPQYKKAKWYLLNGYLKNIKLKRRHPENSGIWYFRINKQYRALAVIEQNELRVFKIDDHQ